MRFDDVMTRGLATLRKSAKTYEEPTFTFLTNFLFGAPGITTEEEFIRTKYRKKENKLIVDTRRGDNAKRVSRDEKYVYKNYGTPYFFYEDGIGRDDRKVLCFGEDPMNRWSQTRRLLYKMNEKVESLRKDMDLVPEKYCADIILEGKISPTVSEFGDITFLSAGDTDFPLSANIFNETEGWDVDTTSIYERLTLWVKTQFRRTGTMPDTLIATSDIIMMIIKDEEIKELMNNRAINIGAIKPLQINAQGYSEFGTIFLPGCNLRLVSYEGFYRDLNGDQQNFLPDTKIILANRNIGSINYGGLEYKDGEGNPIAVAGKELITVHKNDDIPAVRTVKVQRAPLPMPERLNGWSTIKVVDL